MDYNKAKEIHSIICEQFFFKRKKIEVLAGSYEDELEPSEFIYEIFGDVIATNIILIEEGNYSIELISTNEDIYLTPVLEYFKVKKDDIIFIYSNLITQQVKKRPLEIGSSIGPLIEQWRGTLGCFVRDIDSGENYILSNHHVLYTLNYDDNFIIQPAVCDGGGHEDAIGLYLRSLAPVVNEINEFDAAIAGPIALDFSNLIPEINEEINEIGNAVIGMKVYKIGATSGITFGVITSIDSAIKVNKSEDEILEYNNQLSITGTLDDFKTSANFSLKGDSGSLILEFGSNRIVGLLFCGNDKDLTFANKIEPMFNNLGISL